MLGRSDTRLTAIPGPSSGLANVPILPMSFDEYATGQTFCWAEISGFPCPNSVTMLRGGKLSVGWLRLNVPTGAHPSVSLDRKIWYVLGWFEPAKLI